MRGPLNSPVEVGLRAVIILTATYPRTLDVDTLVLLDHSLVHSGDLGGPTSIHPDLPMRSGEMGVKRAILEDGLRLMMRAGMVDLVMSTDGMAYRAADNASAFVSVLESPYATRLVEIAQWIADEFSDDSHTEMRQRMRATLGRWVQEFDSHPPIASEVQ
ncbi:ABC-three component system middle component 2 [Micromonospora sp. L31]|uniref:ABC-three component system middle component 2 n=1 Tax=Micromonospora sp. L31 TaxID=3452213 RepID=UPI003F89F1B0